MCFEVLGFDIMLDQNLKPWLIEVNHTPSFTTDTPLDKNIKQNVIADALRLMNISTGPRIAYKNKRKAELQQRAFSAKKQKMTPEEKAILAQNAQEERDEWEFKHLGGYERVYPVEDSVEFDEDYEGFLRAARRNWEGLSGPIERSRSAKRSAPVPVKVPTVLPTPSSMVASALNQMSRTKQIQAIYSQKLIVGSSNKRTSSSQNSRKRPEEMMWMKGKQNESINPDSLDTTKLQKKSKGATPTKNFQDAQQLPMNKNHFNSHVPKFKLEDEKGESEYYNILKEQEVYDDQNLENFEEQYNLAILKSDTENSMIVSVDKDSNESRNSLKIEDDNEMQSNRNTHMVVPVGTKKQQAEVQRVPPKIRPSTAHKKDANTFYYKRAETPVNYNKLPFPFKHESLTFIKSPKERNGSSLAIKEKSTWKPPVKARKDQLDGTRDFNELLMSNSAIINIDKQAKSFNFGNNRKLLSKKSDLSSNIHANRMIALLADQHKNMNYLALRTFESNIQTPNNGSQKLSGQYSGSKLYSKILNKSSKVQNEVRIQDYF